MTRLRTGRDEKGLVLKRLGHAIGQHPDKSHCQLGHQRQIFEVPARMQWEILRRALLLFRAAGAGTEIVAPPVTQSSLVDVSHDGGVLFFVNDSSVSICFLGASLVYFVLLLKIFCLL